MSESNIIKYVFVINGTSCTTEMVVSHRNQHFAERARDSTTGNQLFAELWVLPNAILHALSKQSIYRVAKKHIANIIHLAIQQRVCRVLQTGHLANLNFAECKPHNTQAKHGTCPPCARDDAWPSSTTPAVSALPSIRQRHSAKLRFSEGIFQNTTQNIVKCLFFAESRHSLYRVPEKSTRQTTHCRHFGCQDGTW